MFLLRFALKQQLPERSAPPPDPCQEEEEGEEEEEEEEEEDRLQRGHMS